MSYILHLLDASDLREGTPLPIGGLTHIGGLIQQCVLCVLTIAFVLSYPQSLQAQMPKVLAANDPISEADRIAMHSAAVSYAKLALGQYPQDLIPESKTAFQRNELLINLLKLGQFADVDAQLAKMAPQSREQFSDMLFFSLTERRDSMHHTPPILKYIDAIEDKRLRVARLLTLAGGIGISYREQKLHQISQVTVKATSDLFLDNKFATAALRLIENRGGIDDLPLEPATVGSQWATKARLRRVGRARHNYPGRAGVYLAIARSLMLNGNYKRATDLIDQKLKDPKVIQTALQEIAIVQHVRGEKQLALATLAKASVFVEEADQNALNSYVSNLASCGDQEAAVQLLDQQAQEKLSAMSGMDEKQMALELETLYHSVGRLRRAGGSEHATALHNQIVHRMKNLTENRDLKFYWPRTEASRLLFAGDPANAETLVDLLPPNSKRVAMRHSVLIGWLLKGDATGARKAYDALIADATKYPPQGVGWQFEKSQFENVLEPWVVRLEKGETLPVTYSPKERQQQIFRLLDEGKIDEALAFLEKHSPTDNSTLRHILSLAPSIHEAGHRDQLQSLLSKAHKLAATGNLMKREEAPSPKESPRFQHLDFNADGNRGTAPPALQISHPRRIALPPLGKGKRKLAAENWAVWTMAELFKRQLEWGFVDAAVKDLQESKEPWLSSVAALLAVDQLRDQGGNSFGRVRKALADPESLDQFERALLLLCMKMSDDQKTYMLLGLRAIPTDRPDAAQRVIELMPDLPHQQDNSRSTNLQHLDQLPFSADHKLVSELYRFGQQAYLAGVVENDDQLTKSLAAMSKQVSILKHPANQAAMYRLLGGIAFAFEKDEDASKYLDLAIAGFAEHGSDWAADTEKQTEALLQTRLIHTLRDCIAWRTELVVNDKDQKRISESIGQLSAQRVDLPTMQFKVGETEKAHQRLSQMLQKATAASRRNRKIRGSILQAYLDANQPDLAWEAFTSIGDPDQNLDLLLRIGSALGPEKFKSRVEKLGSTKLKEPLYREMSEKLIIEMNRR